MSEKKEYKLFQQLLLRAIGPDQTQSGFAEKSGITKYHLNRMINGSEISRPETSTLDKIAYASEGRVSVEQLYAACGYTQRRGDDEMNEELVRNYREGFTSMSGSASSYNSICDFVDAVDMIYSNVNLTYEVGDVREYEGKLYSSAEKYVNVVLSWDTGETSVKMGMVVYFVETSGGKVIVLGCSFDLAHLVELENSVGMEVLFAMSEEDDPDMGKYPVCYVTTYHKKRVDNAVSYRQTLCSRVRFQIKCIYSILLDAKRVWSDDDYGPATEDDTVKEDIDNAEKLLLQLAGYLNRLSVRGSVLDDNDTDQLVAQLNMWWQCCKDPVRAERVNVAIPFSLEADYITSQLNKYPNVDGLDLMEKIPKLSDMRDR